MAQVENISRTLKRAGIELEFDSFTIQGIPGFSTSVLYKGEQSVYEVERQNFNFLVSTADCAENEIKEGLTFSQTDSIYNYRFKIARNPIQDLTGWSRLDSDYVGKELV